MAKIETTPEMVTKVYESTRARLAVVKKRLGRPLTLAEKVVFGHLDDPEGQDLTRGEFPSFASRPSRHAGCDGSNGSFAIYVGGKGGVRCSGDGPL